MKVQRIDHVHAVVRDFDEAVSFFETVLGTKFSPPWGDDRDEMGNDIGLKCTISPLGIEVLAPSSEQSVLSKSIDKRGEGLHAICFKVDDIEAAIEHCQKCGLRLVGRVSKGSLKEAQFHPKDSFGFMLELCEYPDQSTTYIATKCQG
ncbi:MAG: hypothetical protein EPO21_01655 [Chloroflexota bacterium]|nr:MAG: hypothetical protein EPO21_01655 [Chloroflexota bacterium]